MRAKDSGTREETTITAEIVNKLIEPRTGGLPADDDENHGIDPIGDLNIGACQPVIRDLDWRTINRASILHGGMRTGERG